MGNMYLKEAQSTGSLVRITLKLFIKKKEVNFNEKHTW
jgi:hypothetical protein